MFKTEYNKLLELLIQQYEKFYLDAPDDYDDYFMDHCWKVECDNNPEGCFSDYKEMEEFLKLYNEGDDRFYEKFLDEQHERCERQFNRNRTRAFG